MNYLALLGWSPGEGQEMLPIAEMARRFDLTKVGHSASVFDVGKLSWMNRHYMKEAPASRIARDALKYFVRVGYVTHGTDASLGYLESILGMAVGSVDRLEEIPERVSFIFDWDPSRAAALVAAEPDGARAVGAFADEVAGAWPARSRHVSRSGHARAREDGTEGPGAVPSDPGRPDGGRIRARSSIWRFQPSIVARRSRRAAGLSCDRVACKDRARLAASAVSGQ